MQSTYFFAAIFEIPESVFLEGRPMRVSVELTNDTAYPRLDSLDELWV